MKCHYVWDEESKNKVLIPMCWPVIWSNDIRDCSCCDEPTSPLGYERKRYNEELKRKNDVIKELQEDNQYLHEELERVIQLLEKEE